MRSRCRGERPCVNCTENQLACVDDDGDRYPVEPKPTTTNDIGWIAFYKLQAKIAIRQTGISNLASHLPVIREAWANLRDEAKELYQLLESKSQVFTVQDDIDPVNVDHLYPRFLKHKGRAASDEMEDEDTRIMWAEEPTDIKQFWRDVVLGIKIDRAGTTKPLGVVPPARRVKEVPRRVQVEYKGKVYEFNEEVSFCKETAQDALTFQNRITDLLWACETCRARRGSKRACSRAPLGDLRPPPAVASLLPN